MFFLQPEKILQELGGSVNSKLKYSVFAVTGTNEASFNIMINFFLIYQTQGSNFNPDNQWVYGKGRTKSKYFMFVQQ